MKENKKNSKDEILNKILEIRKKEEELKKRKHILQSKRPWYTQATNIIGVITIILTLSIAIFSFISNEEKLELVCTYSEAEPFTNISPNLSNNISVLFNNSKTENIGKIKFILTNNGTKSIKKSDFVDGPIEFSIKSNYSKIENDSLKTIPLLLDVVKIKNAGQRNDVINITSRDGNTNFNYLPSLINPNESVELDALISNINNLSISIKGNIADGNFNVIKQYEKVKKSNFLMLGEYLIKFLGAKWIAITIFIIFFLLSLLKSIVSMEDFEHSLLDYTFGTLFIAIDIFFLAIIISVASN